MGKYTRVVMLLMGRILVNARALGYDECIVRHGVFGATVRCLRGTSGGGENSKYTSMYAFCQVQEEITLFPSISRRSSLVLFRFRLHFS